MTNADKKAFCNGCREDYYNHGNRSTTGECWMLKKAKVVTRYRLGWWTAPTEPGAYRKVQTLNCHNEPGRYACHERLPDFVTTEERARVEGK